MANEYQPRYEAYAYSFGRTPEEQTAQDEIDYPGGRMAGFLCWIGKQWTAWRLSVGRKERGNYYPDEHEAFDQWLNSGE